MGRYELTIYAPNGQKASLGFDDLSNAEAAGQTAITTGTLVRSYGIVRTEDGVLLASAVRS